VANVSAIPVELAAGGFRTSHMLMILTGLALLALTLTPPLLSRRLRRPPGGTP